jgi:hypothetical protein
LSLRAAWSIAAAIALAVICLVALPGAAFAADVASVLVVTCAEEEPASALPPEPMCEVMTFMTNVEDDEGFFAAAPICDPSGASAVAPQPISPIGDDKLEQTPDCDDLASFLQLGPQPSRDDSSPHPLSFSLEPAVIPDAIAAPVWAAEASQAFFGALLGPAEGIRPAVEHPPHAA